MSSNAEKDREAVETTILELLQKADVNIDRAVLGEGLHVITIDGTPLVITVTVALPRSFHNQDRMPITGATGGSSE